MSKQSDKVFELLKRLFPHNRVSKEYYVNYKGKKLFFDFYIRELGILFEIQGQQHTRFIKHFHGDKEVFLAQKNRDNLKIEYVQGNKFLSLVRFNYDEVVTKGLLFKKINDALDNDGVYE
jgi:NAD-dependent SIR2 family protein deacetylase